MKQIVFTLKLVVKDAKKFWRRKQQIGAGQSKKGRRADRDKREEAARGRGQAVGGQRQARIAQARKKGGRTQEAGRKAAEEAGAAKVA